MRKLIYVMLGLMLVAGAGFVLVKRQLRLADDGVGVDRPTASRSLSRESGGGSDAPQARYERRIDRGINQYRSPQGGWKVFEAVIDVLNIVVGIAGIGLALSGMRMRKQGGG